jgi:hypothetical protein
MANRPQGDAVSANSALSSQASGFATESRVLLISGNQEARRIALVWLMFFGSIQSQRVARGFLFGGS